MVLYHSTVFLCLRFQYKRLPLRIQTVTPAHTLLGYFAIAEENVFHKTRRGTSGRAVVNDITLPSSNVRRDKLLHEF